MTEKKGQYTSANTIALSAANSANNKACSKSSSAIA